MKLELITGFEAKTPKLFPLEKWRGVECVCGSLRESHSFWDDARSKSAFVMQQSAHEFNPKGGRE